MHETLNKKVLYLMLYVSSFLPVHKLLDLPGISQVGQEGLMPTMNISSMSVIHMNSCCLNLCCTYGQYHKVSTTFLFKLSLRIAINTLEVVTIFSLHYYFLPYLKKY